MTASLDAARRRNARSMRLAAEVGARLAAPAPGRDAAASVRDFERRKQSREDRSAAAQLSVLARRLDRAESALHWAGYTRAQDGSWLGPAVTVGPDLDGSPRRP